PVPTTAEARADADRRAAGRAPALGVTVDHRGAGLPGEEAARAGGCLRLRRLFHRQGLGPEAETRQDRLTGRPRPNPAAERRDRAKPRLEIVGMGADRDGELYSVDHAGQTHQLEPSPKAVGPSAFPRTLGESGLFLSVKDHRLHPGVIPYSVNSPLWSDGAHK